MENIMTNEQQYRNIVRKFFFRQNPPQPLTKEEFKRENGMVEDIDNRYFAYLYCYYKDYTERLNSKVEKEIREGAIEDQDLKEIERNLEKGKDTGKYEGSVPSGLAKNTVQKDQLAEKSIFQKKSKMPSKKVVSEPNPSDVTVTTSNEGKKEKKGFFQKFFKNKGRKKQKSDKKAKRTIGNSVLCVILGIATGIGAIATLASVGVAAYLTLLTGSLTFSSLLPTLGFASFTLLTDVFRRHIKYNLEEDDDDYEEEDDLEEENDLEEELEPAKKLNKSFSKSKSNNDASIRIEGPSLKVEKSSTKQYNGKAPSVEEQQLGTPNDVEIFKKKGSSSNKKYSLISEKKLPKEVKFSEQTQDRSNGKLQVNIDSFENSSTDELLQQQDNLVNNGGQVDELKSFIQQMPEPKEVEYNTFPVKKIKLVR